MFFKDEFKWIHSYKKYYHHNIDETDLIFVRADHILDGGSFIDKDIFEGMVKESIKESQEIMEKNLQWRKDNPPKKYRNKKGELKYKCRAKLNPYNPRILLKRKVQNFN